jgi:hypothetical protein
LKKTRGSGANNNDTNPSRELVQPMPKPRYIWAVKNGNAPPVAYLVSQFALKLDAPAVGPYASKKYMDPLRWIIRFSMQKELLQSQGLSNELVCLPSRQTKCVSRTQ